MLVGVSLDAGGLAISWISLVGARWLGCPDGYDDAGTNTCRGCGFPFEAMLGVAICRESTIVVCASMRWQASSEGNREGTIR